MWNLRGVVAEKLKQLTTHIENEEQYEDVLAKLDTYQIDFSNPMPINRYLNKDGLSIEDLPKYNLSLLHILVRWMFYLLNLPVVLIWRIGLRPMVPEQEFIATFRFGFSMLAYPITYSLLLVWVGYVLELKTACLIVFGHAALNFVLIKFGLATSFHQRK